MATGEPSMYGRWTTGGWEWHTQPRFEHVHACNCIGPQNGDPVCPCQMPAHMEREAGKQALHILRNMRRKPRIRVKAGSAPA